jgi:hypothetical protein
METLGRGRHHLFGRRLHLFQPRADYRVGRPLPAARAIWDTGEGRRRWLDLLRADIVDSYRKAAGCIDRILRGEKPADLPVQQAEQAPNGHKHENRGRSGSDGSPHAAGVRRRGDRMSTVGVRCGARGVRRLRLQRTRGGGDR